MKTSSGPEQRETRFTAADYLAFATQLTMSQEAVEISELVAEFTYNALGVDRVSVGLLDNADPTKVAIVAVSGESGRLPSGQQLNVGDLALNEAIEQLTPCEFRPADRTTPDAVAMAEIGMQTCLLVPLLSGNRCLGTLNIATRAADIDVEASTQFARLLGSQLDRIAARFSLERQLTEQRRDSHRWQMLRNLEMRLAAAKDLDDVLTSVIDVASQLVAEPHLSFVEVETGSAVVRLADGRQNETLIALGDPVHAGLLERLGAKSAHYVPDLSVEGVPPLPAELLVPGARAVLCVSVDGNSGPLGVLIVSSRTPDGIGLRDREMLNAVAPMVGGALQRIEVDHRLAFSSSHDQLTGLIRRSGFDAVLEQEIESLKVTEQASAVVIIDVDRFKIVNDTEGHLIGDEFLVEVSARLQRILGPRDVATRVGADEFAILLRDRERAEYSDVCSRLVLAVNKSPFFVAGRSLVGTISAGFDIIDADTTSGREAIAHADAACYSAKMVGGNRVKPAMPHDSRQSARRTASQTLLRVRRAIDNDSLTLFGQPIYEIGSSEMSGFEVLVRMQDPDGQLVTPDRFLPIAERFHAIEDLDLWVLRRALMRLSRCSPDAGNPPRLFINLSPTSITSTGFADRVEEILAESRIPADRLCFEITETGTMQSFDEALSFVRRISDLGALVALDDFGVGLSSLSHLQLLPIDVLKIDGSLIVDIENNRVNAAMVTTIQALAEALDIVTIAEFVENPQALQALAEIGVDCGQGFHLGRPAPLCDQLAGAGFALDTNEDRSPSPSASIE